MPTNNQILGNVVDGASSAVGQVVTTKALEFVLGDIKLSKPAEDVINEMQQHFFSDGHSRDFITPLCRTGIFLGKEPFKKAETFAYLGGKIESNQRRLPLLINMNLKEAATLLWDVHCQIALHIMHRRDAILERSDSDHSYVLMYLQESIATVFEQICNKTALTNDEVAELKIKIMSGIVRPFHTYIQNTQAAQSAGARRTALDHNVRETMEKVVVALERFVTEKPLHTSIDSLQQTAQSFNNIVKQMLLAVILVSRQEGEKQQDTKWVLQRKTLLAKAIQNEPDLMLASLLEERAITSGYQGKSGVLYTNLFAERIRLLNTARAETQDQHYFQYIMKIFSLITTPRNDKDTIDQTLKQASEQFNLIYAKLLPSDTFLLKDLLHVGTSDVMFINTAVLLYRQSHELTRFMASLQHFMQLVGKLGLYNNPELHRQLLSLIQSVSTRLGENLALMQNSVTQGHEARVGGWLNPIDEMLQQLRRQGNAITHELQNFQGHFAKIIDPIAMQMEFNKSKTELLQAAVGLGQASQIDTAQMDAISQQISNIQFEQFILPATRTLTEGVDVTARIEEILAFAEDIGQQLERAEEDASGVSALYKATQLELERVREELLKREEALKNDSAHLQTKILELDEQVQHAKDQLVEIDGVVEVFGQSIKRQLDDLDVDSNNDIAEANQLMDDARKNLLSSSAKTLNEQMTLLSRLKGRLEERQKSYQKIVGSVTAFQTEYKAKRGDVGVVLTNVQEIIRDVDKAVFELMAKINALADIILSLRHTLEEKDKQLMLQQAKLIDLENQLAQLKSKTSPQQPLLPSDVHANLSANSVLSQGSFIQGHSGTTAPLSPEYRMLRVIERYDMDIRHAVLVRNRPRKILKYAIWCELNHIVFHNGNIDIKATDVKTFVIAAIKQLKSKNISIKVKNETYFFNDLVNGKTDIEIYLEFLKGKDTRATLESLESSFVNYLKKTAADPATVCRMEST